MDGRLRQIGGTGPRSGDKGDIEGPLYKKLGHQSRNEKQERNGNQATAARENGGSKVNTGGPKHQRVRDEGKKMRKAG